MMINGLKYIRTRCNYSQHELAEILDVTDAMISKWENDNKVISEERQEELAVLLGVPTSFLGQISEKQIEFINDLPMIRQDRKGKEHYRIDMSDDIRDGIWRHYFGKTERSLSDDYNQAKKLKKDTLEEIAETIGGDNTDRFGGIRGAINEIEKGCSRYSFMTRFLRHKNTIDRGLMGFTVVPFGQGYKDMSPPTKELFKLTLEQRIAHGGHPVLRWNVDNVTIKTDPAGNIKADKEKSTEKIDGAIATIMALARALVCGNGTGESVYDSRGLLVF